MLLVLCTKALSGGGEGGREKEGVDRGESRGEGGEYKRFGGGGGGGEGGGGERGEKEIPIRVKLILSGDSTSYSISLPP